jgi:hypothetical protein
LWITNNETSNQNLYSILDIKKKDVLFHLGFLFGYQFIKIEPQEYFGIAWTNPNKKIRSKNLIENIDLFNKMSLWFSSLVVRGQTLEERVSTLTYLINLGSSCISVGNFAGLFIIGSSIRNSAVWRLKQTWNQLNTKTNLKYEKMKLIMSTDKNSANYSKEFKQSILKSREQFSINENSDETDLEETDVGSEKNSDIDNDKKNIQWCIPNLGKHLTELTLTEEGVTDTQRKTELTFDIIQNKLIQSQKLTLKTIQVYINKWIDPDILNFILKTPGKYKDMEELEAESILRERNVKSK